MKHLCVAVAVAALFGFSLAGQAMAGSSDKAKTSSSVPYEPQDYSSPLGGESCSTATPTS